MEYLSFDFRCCPCHNHVIIYCTCRWNILYYYRDIYYWKFGWTVQCTHNIISYLLIIYPRWVYLVESKHGKAGGKNYIFKTSYNGFWGNRSFSPLIPIHNRLYRLYGHALGHATPWCLVTDDYMICIYVRIWRRYIIRLVVQIVSIGMKNVYTALIILFYYTRRINTVLRSTRICDRRYILYIIICVRVYAQKSRRSTLAIIIYYTHSNRKRSPNIQYVCIIYV